MLKTMTGQRSLIRAIHSGHDDVFSMRIRIISILVRGYNASRRTWWNTHGNAQETNPLGISRRGNIGFYTLLFAKRSVSIPRA